MESETENKWLFNGTKILVLFFMEVSSLVVTLLLVSILLLFMLSW